MGRISGYLKQKQPKTCVRFRLSEEKEFCKGLYPSAQGIVGVGPSFFCAVFFEDFGFNQLVMQIVELVLHFAVGQFTVDQVAEVVVVIGRAVVGFQAVVGDGIEVV